MIISTLQLPARHFSLRLSAVSAIMRLILPDSIAVLSLVVFGWLAFTHYADTQAAMDIGVYSAIATRADAVFHGTLENVGSEYPPLATALFWIARSLTLGADFTSAWLTVIVIAAACAWTYLRCFSRRDAAILAFVLPLSVVLLGHEMIFGRYDIFVGLLLILSARTHAHRAYAESAAWLALAVALKIVPVFAIPVIIAATPRRHWKSLALGMICAAVIGLTLSIGVLGYGGMMENIRYVMAYHGGRLVQLESLWSGLSMLHAFSVGRIIQIGYDRMSVINADVPHQAILLAKLLVFAGLGFILVRLRKVRSARDFGASLTVLILWMLVVSPVLSPQYFTWVVPLVFIVMGCRFLDGIITPRGIVVMGLTVLVAYLTQWIFPAHYQELIAQESLPVLMLNVRNLALLLLTYLLLTDIGISPTVYAYLPERSSAEIRRTFFVGTIFAGLALFMLFAVRPMLVVTPEHSGYLASGRYQSVDHLPISRDSDEDTMVVVASLIVPVLGQHRFYRVNPNDCIDSIFVNDMQVPAHVAQFCDGGGAGRIFDFGPYMHTGKNTITIDIRNARGVMSLDLVPNVTPLLFLTLLTVTLVMLWYLVQCYYFGCMLFHTPTRAQTTEMIYTRSAPWITSLFPAQASSKTSPSGQMTLSI